jgi:hypothetical protein
MPTADPRREKYFSTGATFVANEVGRFTQLRWYLEQAFPYWYWASCCLLFFGFVSHCKIVSPLVFLLSQFNAAKSFNNYTNIINLF